MLSSLINHTTEHGSTPSSPPPSNGTVSPAKRKAPAMTSSTPRKHISSPTKAPATPHTPDVALSVATSSVSPTTATPARAALGNLLHPTDIPPRPSTAGSVDADDADDVEADVSMRDPDDEAMEDVTFDVTFNERADGDEDEDDGEDIDDPEEGEEGDSEDDEDDEDDDEDSGDDSDSSEDIVLLDGPPVPAGDVALGTSVKTEPVDGGQTADAVGKEQGDEGTEEAVNTLVPKKKGKRARRSPSSEEDAPPPPPMPTIRITTEFKPDVETLDWNFLELAAQAGYHVTNAWGEEPPAPLVGEEGMATDTPGEPEVLGLGDLGRPTPLGMSADDEARELEEMARRLEEKYDKPTKTSKVTKKRRVIDYDLNDPFIDDSDLKIDAPTHVARPKKEGFFVHMGHLELLEESPAKKQARSKPKTRGKEIKEPRKSLAQAIRVRYSDGPGVSHIDLVDSDLETIEPGPSIVKRSRSPTPTGDMEQTRIDRTLFKNASRDPKYLPPFSEFPEEVGHAMRTLRRESAHHVWDLNNKGKFPEHLKPPLRRAGGAAMQHELLCIADKDPTDSGYERYQDKWFVTALCSILPYNRLTLGKLVLKLCYPDYWKWLQACETEGIRQWKELLDPEIPGMLEQWEQAKAHQQANGEDMLDPEPGEDAEASKKAAEARKTPVFTAEMKDIFKQLVENTQEMVDINKKMEEWHQKIEGQSSELNMRKLLYTKIGKLYPDNFMTSLTLSRAFTNYKRSGAGAKAAKEEQP